MLRRNFGPLTGLALHSLPGRESSPLDRDWSDPEPEVDRMLPLRCPPKRRRTSSPINFHTHPELLPRCIRPSLGDSRFKGDAWIADQGDGTLAAHLGDYVLVQIHGLALDLPSLNQVFERIRSVRSGRRS